MKTIITMEIIIIKIFFLTKPLIYSHKKALYWFVTRKPFKNIYCYKSCEFNHIQRHAETKSAG